MHPLKDTYWLLYEHQWVTLIQGHPKQTVFFETALKDRNMQVRFDLMSVLEC